MNRPSELVNRLASAGQLLFVKYEQLLVDPEQHVDELYRFLDEKLSAERKAELCSVTINGNAFKWKSIMSRRQIRTFDAVAGPTLRRLGYETPEETPLLGVLETVPLRLHNALLRAHALFVLNVVDGFSIVSSVRNLSINDSAMTILPTLREFAFLVFNLFATITRWC